METICNYDHDRSNAQMVTHFDWAWRLQWPARRKMLILNGLLLIGLLVSMLIGQSNFTVQAIYFCGLMGWTAKPWCKYQIQRYRLLKSLQAEPAPTHEIRLGFDEKRFYSIGGMGLSERFWTSLVRYQLRNDVLKIYWKHESWPTIIEPDEVTREFFWRLITTMDAQIGGPHWADINRGVDEHLESEVEYQEPTDPNLFGDQPAI